MNSSKVNIGFSGLNKKNRNVHPVYLNSGLALNCAACRGMSAERARQGLHVRKAETRMVGRRTCRDVWRNPNLRGPPESSMPICRSVLNETRWWKSRVESQSVKNRFQPWLGTPSCGQQVHVTAALRWRSSIACINRHHT